jgi:hypothetical protein
VEGTGRRAHECVVNFITENLKAWGGTVKGNGEAVS